ncbi:reverse transcriptase family protein [Pelomonas sp. UHG3]|uniref:Reverse transcriptase family protein n=1 Tax=Roseateles hydrophilus TaxID=2975054 RepID=A0ACC6C971_9BURK|nr:reverse transcriptase family protein [Pelomonas sp. UHG3]MCY4744955.1 reverse transcriptase family protein [Pelomonas sp. UHG3]
MSVSFMRPVYNSKPIGSVDSLARALLLSTQQLKTLAGSATSHYREFDIPKRDGSFRKVAGPTQELKTVQRRINRQIFENVSFPPYLYGSIKDRNYIHNAHCHARAHVIVAMDVRDFFPSIKRNAVVDIFKHFFHFSDAVAQVLADLCTRNGELPQGACTSSYIANLALYDIEHRFVNNLRYEGLTYSRLIDDISISSTRPLSARRIQSLVEQVAEMLKCHGFAPKRRKTKVASRENPHTPMEVTGLQLNLGQPRVKGDDRAKIRTAVRKCIRLAKFDRTSKEFHDLHNQTSGKVAMLAQLKHVEAKRYRKVLRLAAPLYSPSEIAKTEKIVNSICRVTLGKRDNVSYIERYYQARYRVNIVSRTNASLAAELHAKLGRHAPTCTKDEAIYG